MGKACQRKTPPLEAKSVCLVVNSCTSEGTRSKNVYDSNQSMANSKDSAPFCTALTMLLTTLR